ncbi:MAG: hypothetical protein HYU25_17965 [Candidatus Rokubacteria bacterium]|nr:hypothetical protein [Candidatus Rokubacteria bacterium]
MDWDDTIAMIRRSAMRQGALGETRERIDNETTPLLVPRWTRRTAYVRFDPANPEHYRWAFTAEFARAYRAYRRFHFQAAFARVRKAVEWEVRGRERFGLGWDPLTPEERKGFAAFARELE